MEDIGIFTLIIIAANVLVSYKGFNDRLFFEQNLFQVGRVLAGKEYMRLFMSGFLHVDWTHLIFNMISFYSFSTNLEWALGPVKVAVIYFASLLGGDLLALFIHRNHYSYSAVGASGAVSGIIFAAIALFPGIELYLFLIPVPIPGWLFGAIYVVYSVYGIRSRAGNIGHEAHLGGALIGLLVAIIMVPAALEVNTLPIVLITIPSVIFILLIVFKPEVLMLDNPFGRSRGWQNPDDRYQEQKQLEQEELNRILEKINKEGMDSLTDEEKEILKRHTED